MEKYIVYGKSSCPFCIKIVTRLIKAGKTVYAEMLDQNPEKLQALKIKYDHPTVPIVIVEEDIQRLIGGCDNTLEYLKKEVIDDTSET